MKGVKHGDSAFKRSKNTFAAAFNLISENYTRRKSRRSLDSVVSAIKHEVSLRHHYAIILRVAPSVGNDTLTLHRPILFVVFFSRNKLFIA